MSRRPVSRSASLAATILWLWAPAAAWSARLKVALPLLGGAPGVETVDQRCGPQEWCWALPQPTGHDLLGLRVFSPADVFAVGARGTVLRLSDGQWSRLSTGSDVDLVAVGGPHPGDVVAVGGEHIVSIRGGQVRLDRSPPGVDGLSSVAVVGETLVLGAAGGRVLRRESGGWSVEETGLSGRIAHMLVDPAGDLWVGTDAGELMVRSSTGWSGLRAPAMRRVAGLQADGGGVRVLAQEGAVHRFAEGAWAALDPAPIDARGLAVGTSGQEQLVVGAGVFHHGNEGWSALPGPAGVHLNAVDGAPVGRLMAVGDGGALLDLTARGARSPVPWTPPQAPLVLFSSPGGAVWLLGPEAWRFDGQRWSTHSLGLAADARLQAVSGAGPGFALAVGAHGAGLRWNGVAWEATPLPDGASASAVHVRSRDHAWAVGPGGFMARFEGQAWTAIDSGTTASLRDVWTDPAGTTWVVGDAGLVLRHGPDGWTRVPTPGTMNLTRVWGLDPEQVFVLGEQGTLLSLREGVLERVALDSRATLRDIDGLGNQAVVVGDEGVVVRFDGQAWHRAAGTGGAVLAFDGRTWHGREAGRATVVDIGEGGDGQLYLLTAAGHVLRGGVAPISQR